MILLFLASLIASILLVWFNSDTIVDWGKLIGMSKFLKIDEFYKMRAEYVPMVLNYPTFLKNKYDNFFTKLLACRLCITVWISLVLSWATALVFFNPFMLLIMPILIITSLFLYGLITLLIK